MYVGTGIVCMIIGIIIGMKYSDYEQQLETKQIKKQLKEKNND